jgi:hypothetical protein
MCIDFVHCFNMYTASNLFFFVPSSVMFFVLFLGACFTNDIEGTEYFQYSTLSLCDSPT